MNWSTMGSAAKTLQLLHSMDPGLTGIEQTDRLLQLRTALGFELLPRTMHLREAVGEPFEMKLTVLADTARVDMQALLGEQLSVRLRQEDGSYRTWHCYAAGAELVGGGVGSAGSAGDVVEYELTCRSWLSALAARANEHIYQDKTALQIVEAIFAEYPHANWRVDVSPDTRAAMRLRDYCVQYGETDLAFASRLLAEEGLLYHFEHEMDEAVDADDVASNGGGDVTRARHVLVIIDGFSPRQDLGVVRYTQPRPDQNQPAPTGTISHLHFQAQAPLAGASVGHWDARALHGQAGSAGDSVQPQHFDGAASVIASATEAQRAAEQTLTASELASRRYFGRGNAGHLSAGTSLTVTEHPLGLGMRVGIPLYLLAVEHRATNYLGLVGQGGLNRAGQLGTGEYQHQFEAVPAELSVAPARPARPRAPLALPARVVGVQQSKLTTDRNLRVKVQFDYQRGERPNRAGLDYWPAVDTQLQPGTGNAPGDERSGAWLRVMVPVAGSDWGWASVPRIDSLVLIYFVNGDIDQPVVGGGVYGGRTLPPFSAGVDSGVNHPGTISGLKSYALDDTPGSQWLHDDATGQLRMRLHNAQWGSELALGHLIQQGLGSAQRGAWRGSGFEAISQAWSNVRASLGLLVSTHARPGTYGSAQGTQMEAAEQIALLNGANGLGQRLGTAAAAQGAQGLTGHISEQAVQALVKAIDPDQDGHHPETVNGQPAVIPDDGRAGAGRPVPAFSQPIVSLDSASSFLAASGASTHMYAAQSASLVAQGDLHQVAGHTFSQVSGQGSSLYTHDGGILVHAANGPVSMQAHTDQLELLAQKDITIVSVGNDVYVLAKDKITLGAADSSIELDGINITVKTPGTYKEMGGSHAFLPGASDSASLPSLPDQLIGQLPFDFICDEVIEEGYLYTDDSGTPISGINYKLSANDTSVEGKTSASGETVLVRVQRIGESAQVAWRDKLMPWRDDGDA